MNYITIVAPTYEDAVRSAREQYGERIRIHSRKDVVEKGFLGLGKRRHCELTCFLSDQVVAASPKQAAPATEKPEAKPSQEAVEEEKDIIP